MLNSTELVASIEVKNILGESIIWDETEQCCWWTDIQQQKIFNLTWPEKKLSVYETPERACALGLTLERGRLIVAFESGVCLYSPAAKQHKMKWIFRPFENLEGVRFNDGRMDRQGRFWVSTMNETDNDTLSAFNRLYCISAEGKIGEHYKGFSIGNSLCWSPDSSKMYFSDSPAGTIWQFDFDQYQGQCSNQQIFTQLKAPNFPDGADVDIDGNIWCAEWGGAVVTQYNSIGEAIHQVDIPTSQPTCICFGGKNLDLLFVTTATYLKIDEQLSKEPQAGNLLVFQTSNKGFAANKLRRSV